MSTDTTRRSAMGAHHSARAGSTVWLTPPGIIDDLGPFDLDPCGHEGWATAAELIYPPRDGLTEPWEGCRVWVNDGKECECRCHYGDASGVNGNSRSTPSISAPGRLKKARTYSVGSVASALGNEIETGTSLDEGPMHRPHSRTAPDAAATSPSPSSTSAPERRTTRAGASSATETSHVPDRWPGGRTPSSESGFLPKSSDTPGRTEVEKLSGNPQIGTTPSAGPGVKDDRASGPTPIGKQPLPRLTTPARTAGVSENSPLTTSSHLLTPSAQEPLSVTSSQPAKAATLQSGPGLSTSSHPTEQPRCGNCSSCSFKPKPRVWLNPPYSNVGAWLSRLAAHGDGIALVFARTETRWFIDQVWAKADAVRFLHGRLRFWHPEGYQAFENAGAPSVLVAYGHRNTHALQVSTIPGTYLPLTKGTR